MRPSAFDKKSFSIGSWPIFAEYFCQIFQKLILPAAYLDRLTLYRSASSTIIWQPFMDSKATLALNDGA